MGTPPCKYPLCKDVCKYARSITTISGTEPSNNGVSSATPFRAPLPPRRWYNHAAAASWLAIAAKFYKMPKSTKREQFTKNIKIITSRRLPAVSSCRFLFSPPLLCIPPRPTPLHLAPPQLISPHLNSPCLTSLHLTSPHLTSTHLTSLYLTSPYDGRAPGPHPVSSWTLYWYGW